MAELRFDWDARKAAANQRKHGVSLAEARTVFYDDDALLLATAKTRPARTDSC